MRDVFANMPLTIGIMTVCTCVGKSNVFVNSYQYLLESKGYELVSLILNYELEWCFALKG